MRLRPGQRAVAILGKWDKEIEVLVLGLPYPAPRSPGATVRVHVSGEEEPRKIAVERVLRVIAEPPEQMG